MCQGLGHFYLFISLNYIIKSCSNSVIFSSVGNDLCSSGRMVATFITLMSHVAMNFKLNTTTRPGVQQCQAQGLVFCP